MHFITAHRPADDGHLGISSKAVCLEVAENGPDKGRDARDPQGTSRDEDPHPHLRRLLRRYRPRFQADAAGSLLKSDDFSSLVDALRTIARGKSVITPGIEKSIAENPPLFELTSRQEEILASVMRGLTNADIARLCGMHEQSVKHHFNHICDKTGAANRTETAVIALRKHLLKTEAGAPVSEPDRKGVVPVVGVGG